MIRTTIKSGIIALALISTNATSFVFAETLNNQFNSSDKVKDIILEEMHFEQNIEPKKPTEVHIQSIEVEIVKIKAEEEALKIENERLDKKAEKITRYLESRNAPLAKYTREIVRAGEKYGVEPELIVAISIIESGGGKICFRSHNAWGWGKTSWPNWETAIDQYTEGLSRGYISKGLDTPSKIAPRYCPPNRYNWARNVQDVVNKIGI